MPSTSLAQSTEYSTLNGRVTRVIDIIVCDLSRPAASAQCGPSRLSPLVGGASRGAWASRAVSLPSALQAPLVPDVPAVPCGESYDKLYRCAARVSTGTGSTDNVADTPT